MIACGQFFRLYKALQDNNRNRPSSVEPEPEALWYVYRCVRGWSAVGGEILRKYYNNVNIN